MENTNFFSSKEGNKNPEFMFFCLDTQRQAEKAGFGSGWGDHCCEPGPAGIRTKEKIMEKGGLITVLVGMERKENNIWSSNCQKRFIFLERNAEILIQIRI
jgi:hypothetical protein